MPIDISLVGQSTVITGADGHKKAFTSGRASFEFDEDSVLQLRVQKPAGVYALEVPLADLTVGGVAPASEAAAITALAAVFNSPAGTGLKTRQVLASNVPLSHTGNTTETTVYTGTIPANTVFGGGSLDIIPLFKWTNSANGKTFNVKLGGVLVAQFNQTTSAMIRGYCIVQNLGNGTALIHGSVGAGTNVGFNGATSVTDASVVAVDFRGELTLTVTVQLANGTETGALRALRVTAVN